MEVLYARYLCSRACIQDTLSSRAFRPSARASKGILHTTRARTRPTNGSRVTLKSVSDSEVYGEGEVDELAATKSLASNFN